MPRKENLTSDSLAMSIQFVERRIYLIRDHKVMIDEDLADLYGVTTKVLNQAVQRNRKRFPDDFMFQLNKQETEILRSQFATSRSTHGGRRSLPYAFTEHGVAMLSSVLNSERAIEVNITIMRAFIRLRQLLESNEELNRKFAAVIRKLSTHDKYFQVVFDELKRLTDRPVHARKEIGFKRAIKLEVTNCDLKIPTFIGLGVFEVANCDLKKCDFTLRSVLPIGA